ncbi:hypothetical protein MWH28_02685 [Natroniella sulfidigena]|uniref:hypothetical protein n=1 Tax=Natroniella sulfidigena TaxID=723921 RepID=UPI00200B2DAE|nr:hypothetical protein [Natroniella sulfidigena]MCK8816268.1 hypothetical protein [Natroniella sulfidigena]
MKRVMGLVVMLLIPVFVVVGCAENPRGTFGPSWDVGIQIPAIEDNWLINDLVNMDSFQSLKYDSEEERFILKGESENEIITELEVELDKFELDELIDIGPTEIIVSDQVDGEDFGGFSGEVSIEEFDSITLSDKAGEYNRLEVALTEIDKEKIDDFTVKLKDNSSGEISGEVNFTDITENRTKYITLAAQKLSNDLEIILESNQTSGEANFKIEISSSKFEVDKLEGYNEGIAEEVNFTTNLDIGEEAEVGEEGLYLRIDPKFPEGSNLEFIIDRLTIDETELTKEESGADEGYYKISNVDLNDDLTLNGEIKDIGDVTFDFTEKLQLELGMYGSITVKLPDIDLDAEDDYLVFKERNEFEMTDDKLDKIEENLKEGRLIFEADSTFPADIIVELYVGNEKEDTLYEKQNLVGELLTIPANEIKFDEFILKQDIRDKFRGEPAYLGVKLRVSNEVFESGQDINLNSYAVLEVEINQ